MSGPGRTGSSGGLALLLRVGVWGSTVVVLSGMALCFLHHPSYIFSHEALAKLTTPGLAAPESVAQVFADAFRLRGQGMVLAGLIWLMATPVVGVVATLVRFVRGRDRVFTALALVVLSMLLLSLVLGKA